MMQTTGMEARSLACLAIFALTYGGIALGRIPGLRLDRTGISVLGAALMLAVGALTTEEAYRAIDFDTMTLLLGMMIVVAHLRLSGFFRLVSGWAVAQAYSPVVLLTVVTLMTGLLSAFLVNDAICLVMTPLVIEVATRLGRTPIPYLLAVAMASNVGSVSTVTGNPQNMIIGVISHMPYIVFLRVLTPVALIGLVFILILTVASYRQEFRGSPRVAAKVPPARVHKPQMIKALVVTLGVIGAFLLGVPVAMAAISGAALLLVTRQINPGKVYREIDGPLLLMFASLFVVVAGAEKVLLSPGIIEMARGWHLDNIWVITGLTAALSNLVSNVPAVLALKPFVQNFPDQHQVWLLIAMASTLAGNLTLVGSVANLIVAERARAAGIEVGVWAHLRIGGPLALMTLVAGAWWLSPT
jgi:Na+/H+ antiporter NhaD/arsenite permease-like protein